RLSRLPPAHVHHQDRANRNCPAAPANQPRGHRQTPATSGRSVSARRRRLRCPSSLVRLVSAPRDRPARPELPHSTAGDTRLQRPVRAESLSVDSARARWYRGRLQTCRYRMSAVLATPAFRGDRFARLPQLSQSLLNVSGFVYINRQCLDRFVLLLTPLLPLVQNIGERNPPVGPRALERHFSFIERLDQCWPADAEQVCCLLGGQRLRGWGDRDRQSLAHGHNDATQHLIDLFGQLDRCTIVDWADQVIPGPRVECFIWGQHVVDTPELLRVTRAMGR